MASPALDLRNQSVRAYRPELYSALADLRTRPSTRDAAPEALRLWLALERLNPAEPEIEQGEDTAIRFTWSGPRRYLEVDVFSDGTRAWFFMDREEPSAAMGTQDAPNAMLPDAFYERLAEVSGEL